MKGVTGMMARLGHVPGRQRGGLYGHGDIDFRIPDLAEMEAAVSAGLPAGAGNS